MIPILTRLTKEMVEQLDERATTRGVPRASIIKQYLEEGLKNNE